MNNVLVWIFLIALVFLAGYEIVSAVMVIRKKLKKRNQKKEAQSDRIEAIEQEEEK